MKARKIIIYTVALTLGGCSSANTLSGPRYIPRPEVSQNNYTLENHSEDRKDIKSYSRYEEREQCQNYRKLPRNYTDRCLKDNPIVRDIPEDIIAKSYVILFDFDKSDVRENEMATLDQVAYDISKYDPRKVTVTGYTDSRGTFDYNQTLSRQREQAVSQALLERGIENQTLNRKARGQYNQAVQTADGVKNQENRRVVINFLR